MGIPQQVVNWKSEVATTLAAVRAQSATKVRILEILQRKCGHFFTTKIMKNGQTIHENSTASFFGCAAQGSVEQASELNPQRQLTDAASYHWSAPIVYLPEGERTRQCMENDEAPLEL